MTTIENLDRQLVELQKLKFDKRECPACRGLMETPVPLKPSVCPVCRSGKLLKRKADERWCPICRSGALKTLRNASPIKICPICKTGNLRTTGLLKRWLECEDCGAEFSRRKNSLTLEEVGKQPRADVAEGAEGDSDAFWLPLSGRSASVVYCETCKAHWDEGADGAMTLFAWHDDPFDVAKKYQSLTKAEWARVGQRLKPDAGNLACSKCDADFLQEGDEVTPLHAPRDPYEFVADYKGKRLALDSLRYLGVYKTSGKDGPVCAECRTEFDAEGDYLRLRGTSNPALTGHVEEARPLEDWHRLARGLPAIDEEAEWLRRFDAEIRTALLTGEIAWADRKKPEILWRSVVEVSGVRGRLLLYDNLIEFQSRKNTWSAPVDAVRSVSVGEDLVTMAVIGEPEPLVFRLDPETVAVDLQSGRRQVVLGAADFADSLSRLASAGS